VNGERIEKIWVRKIALCQDNSVTSWRYLQRTYLDLLGRMRRIYVLETSIASHFADI
jgi:hypothetical protein